MQKSIIIPAPAKINIYLDVTGRRADGYHEILSIMQTVSLCDEIYLERLTSPGIEIECDDTALPCGRDNIAWRAAEAFLRCAGIAEGVRIGIKKSIPVAAGLAGGSTDGAAVLRGLNRLFGSPFTPDGLCRIATPIGADLPFCVIGGCAECRGIGEILTPLPTLPDCEIVIATPHERVSTPAAYRALDGIFGGFFDRDPAGAECHSLVSCLESGDIVGVAEKAYNIFELTVTDRKDISKIKTEMLECGAVMSMMSGSGPSVFGIFVSRSDTERAYTRLRSCGHEVFICRPTDANIK